MPRYWEMEPTEAITIKWRLFESPKEFYDLVMVKSISELSWKVIQKYCTAIYFVLSIRELGVRNIR